MVLCGCVQETVPGQSSCWRLLVPESPKKPCLQPLPPATPLYPKRSVYLATLLQKGMLTPLSSPEALYFLPEIMGKGQVTGQGTSRGRGEQGASEEREAGGKMKHRPSGLFP